MRTVKEIMDILSTRNQEDKIWCMWVDKEELMDIITETEYTDNLGNPIELDEKLITDTFYSDVMASVDSADYVWDRFAEDLRDTTRDRYEKLINDKMETMETIDDTELWDKE
jgi:hypothetical protein